MEAFKKELQKAAESILEELRTMSDEDLLSELEACEDYSIGYAVWGNSDGLFTRYYLDNCYFDKYQVFSLRLIQNFANVDILKQISLDAANDEYYALAA